MKSVNNRIYFRFLTVWACLFILLFFVLSYYNQLAADDLYYSGNYPSIGVWGCMQKLYFSYSGRWLAYLLTGWVVSMTTFKWFLLLFNFFTLLTLITGLYFLILKVSRKMKLNVSKNVILLFAVLLTSNLFFTSYSIAETWFWLVQVCTYLWSIIMSLLLIHTIIDNKIRPVSILYIIISGLFIGGASESYALVIIFILTAYLLFCNTRLRSYCVTIFSANKNQHIKIIIALVFILMAFSVTMLAPGNQVRYHALPKASFMHLIRVQLKSFIKIIFIRTPLQLPYLILFSFPWFMLGRYLSESEACRQLSAFLFEYKKHFIVALVLVFIFLLPTSIIMVELGPDRALSQVSFFITCCFCILFFAVGNKVIFSEKLLGSVKYILAGCTIAILIFHVIVQYTVTRKYAYAVNKRIELLRNLNHEGKNGTVELEHLPPSGMLYSAEITADTAHFTNHFLEQALHLRFHTKINANASDTSPAYR